MLRIVYGTLASKWLLGGIVILWIGALLWIVQRGYVWHEITWTPEGKVVRSNFWDIERTPLFVWLTLVLAGYGAHVLKNRSLGYYGLAELICGLVGGFFAIGTLSFSQIPAWLALVASAFVMVQGAHNIRDELMQNEPTKRHTSQA